jgi:hypothetical protein
MTARIEVRLEKGQLPIFRVELLDFGKEYTGRALGVFLGRGMIPQERQDLMLVAHFPPTEKASASVRIIAARVTVTERNAERFAGDVEFPGFQADMDMIERALA